MAVRKPLGPFKKIKLGDNSPAIFDKAAIIIKLAFQWVSPIQIAMANGKSILVIGVQPELMNFSHPDYAAYPGMDAAKVLAGLKASEKSLTECGYDVQMCLTDFGETAEAVVQARLAHKRFDCILIGAGVRTIAGNFLLFEKLINVVHAHAPQARLCFNTRPTDTAEAVQRWL